MANAGMTVSPGINREDVETLQWLLINLVVATTKSQRRRGGQESRARRQNTHALGNIKEDACQSDPRTGKGAKIEQGRGLSGFCQGLHD
jgi:hypothetical protein